MLPAFRAGAVTEPWRSVGCDEDLSKAVLKGRFEARSKTCIPGKVELVQGLVGSDGGAEEGRAYGGI